MSGSSNNECEAVFGFPNMAFIRDAGLVFISEWFRPGIEGATITSLIFNEN
jgi:hypothetical protein